MLDKAYAGTDNLVAMSLAFNYNNFLVQEVLKNFGGSSVVMDFGAGTGTFARKLRDQGLKVICIELDPLLRANLKSDGFDCYADLSEIPEQSVDFIYSLNVFEHIEDDTSMFHTLFKYLKPGGRLYLYVPAFQILYTSMDRKVGHYRRYRAAALKKQLELTGLKVLSACYADSLGFFITLLFKLIGNRKGDLNQSTIRIYDRFLFPLSRILDRLLCRVLGKNVAISAIKAAEKQSQDAILQVNHLGSYSKSKKPAA